jgi:hypothetical protein
MSLEPPPGRGPRNVAVATKISAAEKQLLDTVAARDGITAADALREGLHLFLAIATYEGPAGERRAPGG